MPFSQWKREAYWNGGGSVKHTQKKALNTNASTTNGSVYIGEGANSNHDVKCNYTYTIIETTSIVIFPSLGNGELSVQT